MSTNPAINLTKKDYINLNSGTCLNPSSYKTPRLKGDWPLETQLAEPEKDTAWEANVSMKNKLSNKNCLVVKKQVGFCFCNSATIHLCVIGDNTLENNWRKKPCFDYYHPHRHLAFFLLHDHTYIQMFLK